MHSLYNSKPDVIKEVYAALLTASSEFARNNQTKDAVYQFLLNECKYSSSRAGVYGGFYERNLEKLKVILVNIGTYLPHIVDVNWKIDYIVEVCSEDFFIIVLIFLFCSLVICSKVMDLYLGFHLQQKKVIRIERLEIYVLLVQVKNCRIWCIN